VHHVDLAIGYAPAAWDTAFTLHLLQELATGFTAAPLTRLHAADLDRELTIGSTVAVDAPTANAPAVPDQPPVTVSGPGHALAAWLTGRSGGGDLTVTPAGPLPAVPPWK
jgi:maleylpyruvate isomerase